eukprot:gnl/TRDRNA2_/TRDRNA2_204148_c0_seq1.p1 gnl/TRDRNA2_/TRDRNA2_204148_c0~~gnl/TRDRNA2_/TRDRNA2_204148_c0_seq1.p1  ORF type:complete len:428 (-),score=71.60 gnl/TRDRNA2_/TRDRNA2_204148_c0_seq1:49-1203(-)
MKDPRIHAILRLLQHAGARPKGVPLLLRGGMSSFTKGRFAFCLRAKNEERTRPLPPSPAELLSPGWTSGGRPPALYLGADAGCVQKPEAVVALDALRIGIVINLSSGPCTPSRRSCKLLTVPIQASGDSSGKDTSDSSGLAEVAAAREACEKLRRQTSPCLLYGRVGALSAALFLARMVPSAVSSGDAAVAFVKLRLPGTEFDSAALAALGVGHAAGPVHNAEPSPDPPSVAPPAASSIASPRGTASGPGRPGGGATAAAPAATGASAPEAPKPSHPAEELFAKLRSRDRRGAEAALNTIRTIVSNILNNPGEPKFRRLKGSNPRVQKDLLAHPEALTMLRMAGFVRDGDDLELPPPASLQALRELLQALPIAKGGDKSDGWRP